MSVHGWAFGYNVNVAVKILFFRYIFYEGAAARLGDGAVFSFDSSPEDGIHEVVRDAVCIGEVEMTGYFGRWCGSSIADIDVDSGGYGGKGGGVGCTGEAVP